jgi:2-hydroxy-3-keto-5-methylthiopentenyl-1-phosphate phosphatase
MGKIAKRDNNSNITDKWEFKKIFNIYNKQRDKHGLIYYIK